MTRNTVYLAMEYLELGDLAKCFNQPLPEATVREIAAQVLEGLDQMHGMDFIHSDLKPQVSLLPSRLSRKLTREEHSRGA